MEMYIRPNTGMGKRQVILDEWYRQRMKEIVPGLIAQYESAMKVQVSEFGIKKMKTRVYLCLQTRNFPLYLHHVYDTLAHQRCHSQ